MASILVIDDDGDVRDTLTLVLEDAGHSILTATTGAAGAQLYKKALPDLVITDMIMPGSDGIEAIREIRAINPAARIIATSGASYAGAGYYLKLARRFGATAALPKPFEADELLSIVNACLVADPLEKTPETPDRSP